MLQYIQANLWWFVGLGFLISSATVILLRPYMVSWIDPMALNTLYFAGGIGASFGLLAMGFMPVTMWFCLGLFLLHLAGLRLGFMFASRQSAGGHAPAPARLPILLLGRGSDFKILAIILIIIILLNFGINLLSGGLFEVAADIEGKARYVTNNRFLYYCIFPLNSVLVFVVYVFRTRWLGWLAGAILLLQTTASLYTGSKATGAGFLNYAIVLAFCLAWDGRKRLAYLIVAPVVILSMILLPVALNILVKGDGVLGAADVLGFRYVMSNDLLVYSMEAGFPLHQYPGVPIWILYLGAPLRALGMYPIEYNGVNELVGQVALGWKPDSNFFLPNNNLMVEAIVSQGWVFAWLFLPLTGFLMGWFYGWSRRNFIAKPLATYVVVVFILEFPFGYLQRGSEMIFILTMHLFIFFVWRALAGLLLGGTSYKPVVPVMRRPSALK